MSELSLSHAVSADGTPIALWSAGTGPPLLMVHGMTADHRSWTAIQPFLEPHFNVYAIDRRGRGASGDHETYSLGREYEDVAAAVDHIATVTGETVIVFGHSLGGACAIGAAPLTTHIDRLVLYEPPLRSDAATVPSDVGHQLEALFEAGDHDGVLETFYAVVGITDDEVAMLKSLPTWGPRAAAAHTVIREFHADLAIDGSMLARVTQPTLFLLGTDSPGPVRDDTRRAHAGIAGARIAMLEGQAHMAHYAIPAEVARHIRDAT